MTALQREAFLRSVLMLMPEMSVVDDRYLFGTGPFIFLAREFASNHVTHDERRYRFTEQWFKADPRLSLGGPTIGWARQAVRSMSASLAPGYLASIDIRNGVLEREMGGGLLRQDLPDQPRVPGVVLDQEDRDQLSSHLRASFGREG